MISSNFRGVNELTLKLKTKDPNEIQNLSIHTQNSILEFDNKDLSFELFRMFRRHNLTFELQNVKSRFLADFIKDHVIKEITNKKEDVKPIVELDTALLQ